MQYNNEGGWIVVSVKSTLMFSISSNWQLTKDSTIAYMHFNDFMFDNGGKNENANLKKVHGSQFFMCGCIQPVILRYL